MAKLVFPVEDLRRVVRIALAEDHARDDVTSGYVVPANARLSGRFRAREPGVVAGMRCIAEVFRQLCGTRKRVRVKNLVRDGEFVHAGKCLAEVNGDARLILAAERTTLNILSHLSGIATLARRYARAVRGTETRVFDTRKTLPGLRRLEKYAVRVGGCFNHRMGLHDQVLIKDNHLAAAGSVAEAVRRARKRIRGKKESLKVEVEAETIEQARAAAIAGADIIMLDNMTPKKARGATLAAKRIEPDVIIEISGGVTLKNIARYARAGADRISTGALTQSAPPLDIGFDVRPTLP